MGDGVAPEELAAVQAGGALVVDIRPVEQRRRDGELPGADDAERRVVLVCNEGYGSSLAAHTLQQLGLVNATDLCGGYQAWLAVRG
ncbi:rhodanese-like domain-containing protein [Nocardioides sp. OK12]|uniref:rhodanese-like domain-containing protein n=1 Tax=Nocardioides sp. OK12 TaxID=2758661 RepID=UPI0021C3B247|nr:rhodanese-like domain-containing protein [Nocardioides sp. OK12]